MIGNWIYFRCFIYIYFPGRERKERTVAVPRVVPFVVASQPVPTFATRSLLPDVVRPRPVSSRFRTHVCPRCFLVSARLFFPRTRYSPLATAAEAAAHRDLAHPLLIYRFPFMRAVRRRAGGGEDTCVHTRPYTRACTSLENVNFPGNYFLEKSHRTPPLFPRTRQLDEAREQRRNPRDLHSSKQRASVFTDASITMSIRS